MSDEREVGGTRDVVVALVLALGLGAVYLAFPQDRMTGDAAGLINFFARDVLGVRLDIGGVYYNVAWVPACRALCALTGSDDPLGAPFWLSALSAGLAAGFSYALARRFDLSRGTALTAALLLAVSPAVWFFATTPEVHAPHLLAVAFCAWVTLAAPWSRPALALGLTAAVFPLLYWTQQTSVLLGPGWIFLVQYARARAVRPFRWSTLLLVVGPVLLASLLIAMSIANVVRFGEWSLTATSQLGQIEENLRPPNSLQVVWDDWMLRPLLLVPLAFAGLLWRRIDSHGRAACALLCGLPLAFFLWWRVPERGGYFLGSAPFWAVLTAAGLTRLATRRAAWAGALALVAVQAVVARWTIARFDRGWTVAERVERIRAHATDDTLLVTTVDNAPRIAIWLPEVREISLWDLLADAYKATHGNLTPELFLGEVLPLCDRYVAGDRRVLLDQGWHDQLGRTVVDLRVPYFEPIEREFIERYSTRSLPHPHWALLIVEPRD